MRHVSIDQAIKGLLASNLIFLSLIDFEPDRAGIIAITFPFLNFIFNQKNNICTTEDLNKILQCSDKSIENQRQMRSKFISSLNTFIENQYHLPEAILRVPSEYDKRFVHYTILPSALKAIEQLLK